MGTSSYWLDLILAELSTTSDPHKTLIHDPSTQPFPIHPYLAIPSSRLTPYKPPSFSSAFSISPTSALSLPPGTFLSLAFLAAAAGPDLSAVSSASSSSSTSSSSSSAAGAASLVVLRFFEAEGAVKGRCQLSVSRVERVREGGTNRA